MTNSNTDKDILSFLKQLDLSSEEALLYLALVKHGTLTKLEASRKSGITRTQVYRLVDTLKHKGLLAEITDEHRTLIEAVGLERLEQKIKEKQFEVSQLTDTFKSIQHLLSGLQESRQPGTKVMFYRGVDGIKQMIYNVLRTKGEVVGYSFKDIRSITGATFADRFYQACVDQRLRIRDIYSDQYLESVKNGGFTTVRYPILAKLWQSRYLPKKQLSVDIQMDIYNDVTTFYHWHGDDIFGVEIYNEKVAKFHRQTFELLWQQAIPEKTI